MGVQTPGGRSQKGGDSTVFGPFLDTSASESPASVTRSGCRLCDERKS